MQAIIVYSSKTGNTKKIAEAIQAIASSHVQCVPIENAPAAESLQEGSLLLLGYWVDKGYPDPLAKTYLQSVRNISVGLFGTLGADPASSHGDITKRNAESLLPSSCVLRCSFLCQGRIDPQLVEYMKNPAAKFVLPEGLVEMAESHPNQQDCLDAQKMFQPLFVEE